MAKFLIGVLTGLVLAAFAAFVLFFALVRFGEQRPTVAEGSTLVVKLQGEIPERPGVELPFAGLETSSAQTMLETWSALRRASTDPKIKALVVMPRRMAVGWAKVRELRDSIGAFKKSGKPVYAWLETPTTREYYLATVADRIYVAHEDFLDVKGLRAEMMFFRKTLDKIGVQVEIEHIGKYKDAGDMFSRSSMTPETREVMDSVLDNIYNDILATVAGGRKEPVEEIRAAIDSGPLLAPEAAKRGLVDGTLYEDQMFDELKKKLGQAELKKISAKDYVRAAPSSDRGARVAMVVGQGAIYRGEGQDLSDDGIYSDSFIRLLRQAANDVSIKAAIVRIDSPGGDAIASDDILREMKLLSQKKPTVISMSDVAASGGYYMAMTGDPIVAYPNTFTGSIGVIYGKPNLRGLYDKLGVTKEILKRGQNADIDSDYQPLSDSARKKLRESMESIYSGFVSRVATARKKKYEEIDQLAQGRVWLGSQAKERKLVDDLGGLDRAVELVKVKARIPASERVRLVPFPARKSFFEALMKSSAGSLMEAAAFRLSGATPIAKVIPPGLKREIDALTQQGVLRLMPYAVEVR